MISEFVTLLDKIRLLVDANLLLRDENAALRDQLAAVSADKLALAARMSDAHARIAALLGTIPENAVDEEAA